MLRPWRPDDADALVAAWADPDIVANCSVPDDAGPRRAVTWISGWEQRSTDGISLDLVVADRCTDAALGEVGCWPFATGVLEVGWWTAAPHRGAGRASVAVRLLADWALARTGVHQLVALIAPGHRASEAVAAHGGFVRGQTLRAGGALWTRSAATVHS